MANNRDAQYSSVMPRPPTTKSAPKGATQGKIFSIFGSKHSLDLLIKGSFGSSDPVNVGSLDWSTDLTIVMQQSDNVVSEQWKFPQRKPRASEDELKRSVVTGRLDLDILYTDVVRNILRIEVKVLDDFFSLFVPLKNDLTCLAEIFFESTRKPNTTDLPIVLR